MVVDLGRDGNRTLNWEKKLDCLYHGVEEKENIRKNNKMSSTAVINL
jgi:hypothetical protein